MRRIIEGECRFREISLGGREKNLYEVRSTSFPLVNAKIISIGMGNMEDGWPIKGWAHSFVVRLAVNDVSNKVFK
jgi:hypothetical protein